MITQRTSWLTILLSIVVGILLIVWHSRIDILEWIIIAMAVLIAVPSVYSLCVTLFSGKNRGNASRSGFIPSVIPALAGTALAAWMLFDPAFFVGMMAYLLAILLIIYGVGLILILCTWRGPVSMSGWLYVIPVLLIIAGVVILSSSVHTMNSVVVLITGISLIAAAVNQAIGNAMMSAGTRASAKVSRPD